MDSPTGSADALLGRRAGHYRLIERLGEGGMGVAGVNPDLGIGSFGTSELSNQFLNRGVRVDLDALRAALSRYSHAAQTELDRRLGQTDIARCRKAWV